MKETFLLLFIMRYAPLKNVWLKIRCSWKMFLKSREQIKLKIELHEQYKVKAAQIRARVWWVADGQKTFNSRWEYSRTSLKIMTSIKDETGGIYT